MEDSALSFERVRRMLEGAQLRVLVLDVRRKYKRGGGGGLAPTVAASGEVIAYATEAGDTAADRGEGVGWYAGALAEALALPGVEIQDAFQEVTEAVLEKSNKDQFPVYQAKLEGRFYFNGRPPVLAPPGGGGQPPGPEVVEVVPVASLTAAERWKQLAGTENEAELERFVKRYGGQEGGAFWTKLAEQRLEGLREAGEREREAAKLEGQRREAGAAWAAVRSAGTVEAARLFVETYGGVAPDLAAEAGKLLGEWENTVGMEFVRIEAGSFEMGSPAGEAGRYQDEGPVHAVRISRGFWLGKYEVTQGEWEAVMGTNPSGLKECGARCPVENVSWDDTQEFIRRLNELASGRGYEYRLPTEAEWEYAARAGTRGARYGEVGEVAWYGANSGGRTQPVGQKRGNAWGLHDMLGNVYEWVGDWYGEYPSGAVTDPRGPGTGSTRVRRGGGWYNHARGVRSANRSYGSPGDRDGNLGFRLARTE